MEHDGYQHGVQMAFTPLGARALLGHRAGELAGEVVDLGALLGPAVGELTDRLATLATEVGWSRQHLRAMFLREFGLSPKQAARVVRFELANRLVAQSPRHRLADVAAGCGYTDQAHLTRDWHAFAGTSPSTWLAEELPFVQDTPVPTGPS